MMHDDGGSIERGMRVEREQGEGARDAHVEKADSEKIVEEVVERGLPHAETLGKCDPYPNDCCSQPVDVSI
jgi:hypothetical protein